MLKGLHDLSKGLSKKHIYYLKLKFKKVLIYGIGRLQKDFEYMFPKIRIRGYISKEKIEYNGKKVINNISKESLKGYFVIICDRKSEKIINEMNSNDLHENIDYVFMENIAFLLNDYSDFFTEKLIEKTLYKKGKNYNNNYIPNEGLFQKMIYTDSKDREFCYEPFQYAHVQPYGYVYSCCPRIWI